MSFPKALERYDYIYVPWTTDGASNIGLGLPGQQPSVSCNSHYTLFFQSCNVATQSLFVPHCLCLSRSLCVSLRPPTLSFFSLSRSLSISLALSLPLSCLSSCLCLCLSLSLSLSPSLFPVSVSPCVSTATLPVDVLGHRWLLTVSLFAF